MTPQEREARLREIEKYWGGTGEDRDFLLLELKKLETELNQAVYMQEKVREERDRAEKENAQFRENDIRWDKLCEDAIEQRDDLQSRLTRALMALDEIKSEVGSSSKAWLIVVKCLSEIKK
jgi:chromosome segregation ATPase